MVGHTRERLVLVHGSATTAAESWSAQVPLEARYDLLAPDRPGFPGGPPGGRVDFDEHAVWLRDVVRPGDHVVGHSYGGVVALLAAAERPDLGSLTVIEPPCFAVAPGDPDVAAYVDAVDDLWTSGPADPRRFLEAFLGAVGFRPRLPDPLPPELEATARVLRSERPPTEATIPLDRLRLTPFPKLVVSGAHHPAYDAVCDVLEGELPAERAVVPGAGHACQLAPGFNERLLAFLA